MKIGNIVSTTNINVSDDFNVVQSLDEIIQGLPTLIIGWDYVKKNYPDYDVTDRKLSDNLYWTVKKTEKRDIHEEDLFYFIKNSYKKLIDNISYYYLDPFNFTRKQFLRLIEKLNTSKSISYHHDNMIYIYIENYILGIDIEILEFIGFKRDKIITKINNKSTIFLTKDAIFIEYKHRIENFENQVKYIPVLYSIENG
jgi:hypothetical protein